MAGAVIRLDDVIDPSEHFDGPWKSLRVHRLGPGESIDYEADDTEAGIYVISGSGEADLGSATVPLRAGDALTFVKGSAGSLRAGEAGLDLFIVTLLA
jgi:quercetin dioxygenase-like cupin family protein